MQLSAPSEFDYSIDDIETYILLSSPLDYDLGGYFEPYVLQYLVNTDLQTAQWVHTVRLIDLLLGYRLTEGPAFARRSQSIKYDLLFLSGTRFSDQTKFEAEGEEGHSSSIIDLFSNLKSPIDYLSDLHWPDPYQEAKFFTTLSKARQVLAAT